MFEKVPEKVLQRIHTRFLLLPFMALTISTMRPELNILDNPLSVKAIGLCAAFTLFSYFAFYLYLIAIVSANERLQEHDLANYGHLIGCVMLTFAIALTIRYLPSKADFESLAFVKSANTIRIVTLYLLGMETLTIPR